MVDRRKELGARGEHGAGEFLTNQGYQLIDSNVRPMPGMARGEIDFVAWHGEFLVFIEVKTRRVSVGNQGMPREAITIAKQKQLSRLASFYVARYKLVDVACRFDVVEVIVSRGQPTQFSLIPNAFDVTGIY